MIALEEAPCPLCGQADAALVMRGPDWLHQRGGEFTVVRCRHCGLVYQNQQPTSDSTALLYPADSTPLDTPRKPQPSRSVGQPLGLFSTTIALGAHGKKLTAGDV